MRIICVGVIPCSVSTMLVTGKANTMLFLLITFLAFVSAQPPRDYYNAYVPDAGAFFNAFPSSAVSHKDYNLHIPRTTFPSTHIQGMAYYNQYEIFTHNNDNFNDNHGWIVFYNTDNKYTKVYNYYPEPGYHHPSGIQVIGDYLVVGLEMSADSGGSPNANPSYIKIYDISALRLNPLSPSNPDVTLIEVYSMFRQGSTRGGASATGITYLHSTKQYVLATYTTAYETLDVYTSTPGAKFGDLSFDFVFQFTAPISYNNAYPGYQGLNLFTEGSGTHEAPYVLGFRYREHNTEDWLDLVKLDIASNSFTFMGTRHLVITPSGGTIEPPHFRWGTGADWYKRLGQLDVVKIYTTGRNTVDALSQYTEFCELLSVPKQGPYLYPFMTDKVEISASQKWRRSYIGTTGNFALYNYLGKALDGNLLAMDTNNRPFLWDYQSTPAQQWRIQAAAENPWFFIVNVANGLVLDGNSNVQQLNSLYPIPWLNQLDQSATNQMWRAVEATDGSGTVFFVNRYNQKALDSNYGVFVDIKYPFMWAPAAVPSANHLWIIQRPTPTSTQFRIVTSDQLFVLDGFVNLGSNALQQHTYLSLLDPTSAYQQWTTVTAPSNCVRIVNAGNNYELDGNTGDPGSYPLPFMWPQEPSAQNHHWQFEEFGDFVRIKNCKNGKVLDYNTIVLGY